MKKIILSVTIIAVLMTTGMTLFAGTNENSSTSPVVKIPPVIQSSCTMVDPEKVGTRLPAKVDKTTQYIRKPDTMYGQRYEQYSYSTYTYAYYSINNENVGPRINDKLITSVAKGATRQTTINISLSATITYTASCSAEIEKVVNLGVSGSVSGTVSGSWNETRSFVGPPEGSRYSSRKYYAALNYNKCTAVVHVTDHYAEHDYNASRPNKDIIVNPNSSQKYYDKSITGIKVPTRYEYSTDVN